MKPRSLVLAVLALCGAQMCPTTSWAASRIWITNVKLVSPENLEHIEPGSVLIENGRIARVDRGAHTRRPGAVRVVDGQGYYLTPGLIDSHVHLGAVPGMNFDPSGQDATRNPMIAAYFKQLPRSYLYYGYTTVVDLAVVDRGTLERFNRAPLHPDTYDCGSPLVFANGYPMSFFPPQQRFKYFPNFIYDAAQSAKIPAEYEPQEHTPAAGVERVRAAGGICVKTHFERGFGADRNLPVMSPAVFAQVRAAATKDGLVLVTHANSFEAQTFAVEGSADVLAHGMWHWGALDKETQLPPEIQTLLDKIVEKRIGYQPTMQVLQGLRVYFDPDYLTTPALTKVMPAALLEWFASPEGKWFKKEINEDDSDEVVLRGFDAPLRRERQVVAYLAAKNANFLFGTDTPSSATYGNVPGLNGYLEMQQLRQAGMSLTQIFKAATINNARTFKLDATLGSIEAGKAANLLLMKMSPLADVAAYDSIVTVWVGGKQVARERLAVATATRTAD
ncbi:MAG TPA: amidohydrolase [Janthinobacterium sp.]|nr:amidohydrolase [Janthinobacterium sp.]